jgi:hypothetical protein
MKYIAVLLVAGGVYLTLARPVLVPASGATPGASQSDDSAAGTDFLKAPLDRTHEVLKQARTRAQDPALQ